MLLFFFLSIIVFLCIFFILINLNFRFVASISFGSNTKYKNKRRIEISLCISSFKIITIDLVKHKDKIENTFAQKLKNRKTGFKGIGTNMLKLAKKIEIVKFNYKFISPESLSIEGYLNIIVKLKLIHILNMLISIIYERGNIKKHEGSSNRRFNAYCHGKH